MALRTVDGAMERSSLKRFRFWPVVSSGDKGISHDVDLT